MTSIGTMKISALATVFCTVFTIQLHAQTFDTSGNSSLKGDYFVRQVVTANFGPTGGIGRGLSLTGVMTFNGTGGYTFTGQLLDSQVGSTARPFSFTGGTYSLASNGLLQIQNPIDATDTEYGAIAGLGPLSIIASATEGNYRDFLVAIPAGSSESSSTSSMFFSSPPYLKNNSRLRASGGSPSQGPVGASTINGRSSET